MRLRCPNKNCPIDVPDDFVGARIRCPHCGHLLFVDTKYADAAEQVKAGLPDMSLGNSEEKSRPPAPIKLENQIYDGLPPLALMIALRRQQAGLAETEEIPMTADDWKALSAFESVVDAVIALRTTLLIGAFALVVNLLVWVVAPSELNRQPFFVRIAPVAMIVLLACLIVLYVGSRTLLRIKLDLPATLLPWSALVIALLVGSSAIMNVLSIFDPSRDPSIGFSIFAALPFNALAAFDSSRSAWRVGRSIDQVSPPEISHRLTEALKYLD